MQVKVPFADDRKRMNFCFHASYVECTNALDWEIQQVRFDTVNDSKHRRESPYLLVSQNFEFPGPAAIEWYDGKNYDGGGKILSAILEHKMISFFLDQSREIKITLSIDGRRLQELEKYLKNILGCLLTQK
jgi:hypothetical protein